MVSVFCFAYAQIASAEDCIPEFCDCGLGVNLFKFNEAKAAGASCFAVSYEHDRVYWLVFVEKFAYIVFGSSVREVTDVEFLRHRTDPLQ